jgi:hypothetical protein
VSGPDSCALSLCLARRRAEDFRTGISGGSLRSRSPRSDFHARFCSTRRQILGAFAVASQFSASGSSVLFSRFHFASSSRSRRQAFFGQALRSRISACGLGLLRSSAQPFSVDSLCRQADLLSADFVLHVQALCFGLWSAVPDFGLICFPSVVVPALSVVVA